MGKNKLRKFSEMETFHNVFQCSIHDITPDNPVAQMAGHWNERYFHNDHPITLELGCGRGEYTVGLAQRYPERNFIGVDIKGARIWAGAKQAELAHMPNVAFLRTNIESIPHFFAPAEVERIWITFPDPQMKKATKRLTSTYFMQRYLRLLQPGGTVHLKTDSPFLYTYTREMLRLNDLPVLADTDDLYAVTQYPDAQALQTHYEHQWLDRGLTIKYLAWQLLPRDTFAEPDIDIEKDNYRSYGRNYVSTANH
ncbi:MAG: tRNA (guanosine(46)-N7)-methyltransferase TrmB [Paludibacteraceae bacterium]|nr:tRNA (guanosine(46)-N7)-methyltransferase TrmB [Paludibacteraceae bacterium]MBR1481283.1 tRNA (guanosine(46)-N7)-methyltransferase TrmB [Paludibacteraceae bacterium]